MSESATNNGGTAAPPPRQDAPMEEASPSSGATEPAGGARVTRLQLGGARVDLLDEEGATKVKFDRCDVVAEYDPEVREGQREQQ